MVETGGYPRVTVTISATQCDVHAEHVPGGLVQVLGVLQAGLLTAGLQLSHGLTIPVRAGADGLMARAPLQGRKVS